MARLGQTKYSIGVTWQNGYDMNDKVSKTYTGFNFTTGGVSAIANEANEFIRGTQIEGSYEREGGLEQIAIANGYSASSVSLITTNEIESGGDD